MGLRQNTVDETHRRSFKIIFTAREENPKISLTSDRLVNSYQSEKMTETEVKSKNGSNGTATSVDVENRIIQQVEYYFGDFNLPRDKFLQEQLKNNEEGWIGIDVMLKFQRLNKISDNGETILKALKQSTDNLLEVDIENKKIRRNPEVPLPEKEDDDTKAAKTVYCKGFEKDNTTLDDLLAYFAKYDGVVHVNRRTWVDRETNTRNFKGSIFVTFKDKASADKFMAEESVKSPSGEELIRKWQADYNKEKQVEYETKKAERNKEKKSKNATQDAAVKDEKVDDEPVESLPLGAVLYMDGFKNDTMREDIKKELDCDDAIAFVDFERGKTTAWVRFKNENAAKDLAEKLNEKYKDDEKLKVKDSEIVFRVLEGDEEKEYLEKAAADIKQRKQNHKKGGHKRRHGGGRGGGRGGKRGRY